ncbi:hypothetical protein A2881_03605 [Candidatus Peribacteria bacterium RIFCSPHIGHO2_01_FULL_55_13]|nr:MAG: hypothetical protein A2881_03605 [Candidatus Peribacteria bacterium RIFCSPHIGHO2_01_FULL_55_13]OGJ66666.1 MAG: hypothetical protein A3F36_02850 [Candidatus Peribacteria bacterium RIFCSPHIGHO2_12_FULL_55_11]
MLLHDSPSDGYILVPEQITVPASSPDASPVSNAVPNLTLAIREPTETLLPNQVQSAEHVRRWTSDQIDRGHFGLLYHPITGNCIVGTRFDEARHCHVVEHQYSGWGENTAESEQLSRIGDGKDHAESDFPLPHWKFHWQTRQPLQK